MVLAEGISRHSDSILHLWSLVTMLTQIYIQKEQAEQGNTQNVQIKENGSPRKCNVGAKSHAQGNKKVKEKPAAKRYEGSDDLKTIHKSAKIPSWEEELMKSLSSEENRKLKQNN